MPKDEYQAGKDKDTARRSEQARLGEVSPEDRSNPAQRAINDANTSIGLLKKIFGADLEITSASQLFIRMDLRPLDQTEKGVVQETVKSLGYQLTKGKNNPLQVTRESDEIVEIRIDTARFAKKCADKKWDCSPIIPDEAVREQLLSQTPPQPNPRLGPGESQETQR